MTHSPLYKEAAYSSYLFCYLDYLPLLFASLTFFLYYHVLIPCYFNTTIEALSPKGRLVKGKCPTDRRAI